jgi:hypothetical protein
MQIKFRDIRGSKHITFWDGNRPICSLEKSKFRPEDGYVLWIDSDFKFYKESGHKMTNVSIGIKKFTTSNAAIDYVHANFDQLVERYNEQIANSKWV